MIEKETCPGCGEKTLERIWMGLHPQKCPECGYQPEIEKISY